MKKRLLLVPAIALALCAAIFASGCNSGPTVEEIEATIREDVSDRLGLLQDPESDEYQELVGAMESSLVGMEDMGVSGEKVVDSLLDGYEYEVTSVSVDQEEGTAEVEVAVTCKSLSDMNDNLSALQQEVESEVAADPERFLAMSEAELMEYTGEKVMGLFDDAEPRETDLTLTYSENDDGEWEADEDPLGEVGACFQ